MQGIAVSIIVPFYNAKKNLASCVQNICNQKFNHNFEIILVNDGSTDTSYKKLKQKFKIKNLKLFSYKKNKGPAAARNFGLKKAEGEYIFFLDVDDKIERNTLFRSPVAIEDRSTMNVAFVFNDRSMDDNEFLQFCDARGLKTLKGHRSVGGFRASIYNAMPIEGVDALIKAMQDYEDR